MINIITTILKYWKAGGVILLIAAFLMSFHFARVRGERLEMATAQLNAERLKFRTQLQQIEKEMQDDKERGKFRTKQTKKIKLAGDSGVRDAYELLRERQASHIAR